MEKIGAILQHFLSDTNLLSVESLSGGVIHQTYKVLLEKKGERIAYILQCMNTETFKNPTHVMKNTILVQEFLMQKGYPLDLSIPLSTKDSKKLFVDEQGQHWRFFKFINQSESFEKATNPEQLYEAGKAFGMFLTYLKDFDAESLEITIPDFHHIKNRYETFLANKETASAERKTKADQQIKQTIDFYKRFQSIDFSKLPVRATHNDCKLSNLLFDKTTKKCIAVIDLDTLMPGYVPTDFGDMVRTMCNTATEDETDLNKVAFDLQNFESLYNGFLEICEDWLSPSEKDNLLNGTIYIILEQAIRFLSDYLNNDQYYKTNYPEHNLARTKNQLHLLTSMLEQIPLAP